jgi:hypothetical protein
MALGLITLSGGVPDCSMRWDAMLWRNALVTSAFAAAMDTPGFRLAIGDIHPQLYVSHQLRPLALIPIVIA